MARLTAAARRRVPKSQFGLPGKAPDKGSYPMPDKAHARVAKSFASRFASPSQRATIDAKANKVLGKKGDAFDKARRIMKAARGK